ncbi:MAG TPA: DUF4231 domain-containing protein [Pyrinomonadaceae bacterium]|nr:DUF4231 domain-containing protein [Pyrinomonadaceae bacterium]
MDADSINNKNSDINNEDSDSSEIDRDELFNELKLTSKQYMRERVHYKMKVYGKLSKRHRWLYYISSFTSIVCAAVVPVLIVQTGDCYKFAATVLSLIVTILVSMEKLFHFRQHWRNYDSIESFLRSEQVYFQTRSGVYDKKKPTEAFELFVRRIEDGIKNEREQTIEMRTQEITK